MPRKGENIYRRKDGRWEGRVITGRTDSGKAIYKSLYASTYTEVKTKVKKQNLLIVQSDPRASVTETPLFSEMLNRWSTLVKPNLKESSYNKYQNLIAIHIIPHFGGERISDMTVERMQNYINLLLTGDEGKKGLSPKTVRDIISIIKRTLQFANSLGYKTSCNYFKFILPHKPPALNLLSTAEREKLISYLLQSSDLQDLGILLTLFTGLRIGEICALTWADICLPEQQLIVRHTLQRVQDKSVMAKSRTRIVITSPKSSSSVRIIPLPYFLVRYLGGYHRSGNEFLLTGMKERFVEPRTLENHFKKILKRINMRNINFHALRHSFATQCVESGFDIKSLSEILGHSNANITLNRYVHPSNEVKRRNMDKLEELFAVREMVI